MSSAAPMQQAKIEALAKTTDRSIQLAPQSDLVGVTEHTDLRTQANSQRQLQRCANHSQQSRQFKAMQQVAQANARATQLKSISNMMNAPSAQRVEDEEALQAKSVGAPVQREARSEASQTPKPNNTGLPDNLKSGIESLSGISMDHVKVHYNSSQPAQLNAHAYAQGSDIHVAPGQEQHLPHEAWHVVQQAQGRVKPTMQMKSGVAVNDDAGLEAEADVMGAKALNTSPQIAGAEECNISTGDPINLEATTGRYATSIQQLKSIEQINQIAGLTDEGNKALNNTQDGPNTGKLYSIQTALGATKSAALVSAAVEAGNIGERIQAQTFVSKQKVTAEAKTVLNQKKGGVGTQLNTDKAGIPPVLNQPIASNQELINAATTKNLNGDLDNIGVPNNIVNINYSDVYEGAYTPPHPMAPVQVGKYAVNMRAGYEQHLENQIYPKVVAGDLGAQASLKFLDPLTLRVKTSYGANNGALELDYQFGHDWPGYIVKIKHDNGVGDAIDSDMAIRSHLDHTAGNGVPDSYSNVHDTNDQSNLVGLLDTDANDSKETNELKIDAHARLAGEGARWVAVRNHVANLNNGSRFYIEQPGQEAIVTVQDRDVWYVDFRSLWLSWEPVFQKKYNITNATFIAKLGSAANWGGDGRKGDKKRSDMGANDYEVV